MKKRTLLLLACVAVLTAACGSAKATVAGQMYVAAVDPGRSVVIPVTDAGRSPGKPIKVGSLPSGGTPALPQGLPKLAITPDGKTLYATDGGWNLNPPGVHNVIPISTASGRAGKPIPLTNPADDRSLQYSNDQLMVVTPDGKTVLAADGTSPVIIPIDTATNKAGAPIKVAAKAEDGPFAIAVTPDSKTAYAVDATTVVPVDLATRTAGKPISVGHTGHGIAISPDGATAFVVGYRTITPIDTATNTAGRPITVASAGPHSLIIAGITPDGSTVYVADARDSLPGLVPVSTATHTAGKPIRALPGPVGMVFAPDGKTALAGNGHALYALGTTANTIIARITLKNVVVLGMAFAADGKTVWVSGYRNSVNGDAVLAPISTTTYRAGAPINIDQRAIGGCVLMVSRQSGHTLSTTC